MVLNETGVNIPPGVARTLIRGLAFVPAVPIDAGKLHAQVERLRRSINLRLYWKRTGGSSTNSLVSRILKSRWDPPNILRRDNRHWMALRANLARSIAASRRRLPNLPRQDLQDWNKFNKVPDYYVTKADKGGRMVIWNAADYRAEALRQLDDSNTYKELSIEEVDVLYFQMLLSREKIVKTLLILENITLAESKRILDEPDDIPGLYLGPKIHKAKRPEHGGYAGRPIIAQTGSIWKVLDKFLADLTAPLLPFVPGSLIDTTHLLQEIEKIGTHQGGIPAGATLFSADVEALYPSMPWEETLESTTRFYAEKLDFLKNKAKLDGTLPPPEPWLFRQILKLILENNIFHFQDQRYYHQSKGTAMGCSTSVFMAVTFMHYRNLRLIQDPPPGLLFFKFYIDDIVGIWLGPKEEIPGLFSEIVDESIKLTYEIGGNKLNVLDVTLTTEADGKISSCLYRKPTDGHQFVHWSSDHKETLLASIPYSQLIRVRRNCSKEDDFKRESKFLLERFRRRGYPETILEQAFLKASALERSALLKRMPPKSNDRLIFITNNLGEEEAAVGTAIRNFYKDLLDDPLIADLTEYYGAPLPLAPPMLAAKNNLALGSKLGVKFKRSTNVAVPWCRHPPTRKEYIDTFKKFPNFGLHPPTPLPLLHPILS